MDNAPAPKPRGLLRLRKACTYSLQGLSCCFEKEEAFRQEVMLAIFAIPLGLWLGDTAAEKALLAGSILFLMIVEILNTGLERVVDRISTDHHPLSGEAKDMGSAAVMLAIGLVALVWIVILVG